MKPPEPPPLSKKLPFFQSLSAHTKLAVLKVLVAVHFSYLKLNERHLPANRKPTIKKSYAPLRLHSVRVWIPSTYNPGDKPLPLYIDIHGGGFCIGSPRFDDKDNEILCHTHGFVVVSIPYRLGPEFKFPTAHEDCAAMITAVLNDDLLPVDRTRVVIGGYSAGGNMALGAIQQLPPELKARIKATVAYYPATNNATETDLKLKRQVLPDGQTDSLRAILPAFSQGYVKAGQDRSDPRLSPIFAKREDMPEKICIIGCELDVLYIEAKEMIEDLAEHETGERKELGDGRNGWTQGNLRWESFNAVHGFNQRFTRNPEKAAMTRKMHQGVADWLKKEVYSC